MFANVFCLTYPGAQVDGTFDSDILLNNILE